ncbi:hypothetical protein [Actinomadura litoris]|uniref:hypothetical protein n=1 Tax=Actinomadura litoris TaxID=2678616 RepID=UPI001FA74F60|nr:hypothetical protein [Actinomadura litoris]
MTIIRRIGVVALATPLAMSFPVLTALPARAAGSSVTAPASGTVITSGSQVTASAHFDFAVSMQLRVIAPGSGDRLLKERLLSGTMSAPVQISRNGKYTVQLKGAVTHRVYDSSVFTVRIPPAVPSGATAKVSGGKLVVKWNRGSEEDLNGYALAGTGVQSKSGSVGSFCSGARCSASLPVTQASGPVSVGIRAKRPGGDPGPVYSGAASVNATVSGGVTGSSPAGSTGRLPSGAAGSAPSSGGNPLTPFNTDSPITLPSVQPDGATPGFAYPTPQLAEAPKAQNVAATDRLQWGRSVGIALVLLVVAAHLGTWTRRLRVAQAGTSSRGMAARVARGGTGRKRVKNSREKIARAEAIAKTTPVTAGEAEHPTPARGVRVGRRPASGAKGAVSGVSVRIAEASAEKVSGDRRRPSRGRRRK